jgi:two-component system cell cycle response regulator DivK
LAQKILIVERNKLNMKLFNDVLQTNGYDTIQSIDGQNIVQLARNNRPDLIMLDIQLPEKTGLGVARMLKADNDLKGIPVIAITAHAMGGDKSKFIEGGFDGYMAKPISIPTFLEVIADFLH